MNRGSAIAIYGLVMLAALILQATVVDFMQILTWKPDLVLIVLVVIAIDRGKVAGSSAGFAAGLLSDLMAGPGTLIGLGALAKSVTGYAAAVGTRFFRRRSQFIFILLLSGVIHDLLYFYVTTIGRDISWSILLRGHMIGSLLYTALVGVLVYPFLGRLFARYDEP